MTATPAPPPAAEGPDPGARPPALAPAQRKVVIAILGALSAVSPFSIDMYLAAFPQIAADLRTTTAQVSLSIASYFVGLACGQLVYGPFLDRYGRKPPLYAGLGLYLLATVACLFSPSVGILVALRFLQALGGCVAQVASVAMVRDFFPAAEGARIFSLLMLILGVSPLLAPTVGGIIATELGWRWVFITLFAIASAIVAAVAAFLPAGQAPDGAVVLRPGPILRTFLGVLGERAFVTYTLAGACSFAGLFVYVAGSPIIFMEEFHVGARAYGMIFALLSVGFIGGNQVNILLGRWFAPARIFTTALAVQAVIGLVFAIGAARGWFGLPATVALLFSLLGCLGFTYPNAAALALAPFTRNVGSASALLGFLQMGVGALAASGVGLLDAHTLAPIIALLAAMAWLGLGVLWVGRWRGRAVGA